MLGKEDGSFGVHEQITRQDMAVIIYRLVQQLKLKLGDGGTVPTFADQHDFASYASESILYLQQKGIVNGLSNGRFVPLDPSTRAQAAAIVYRLFTSK
ncbi:Endo-1,4-beta-xylanase A precursor [compost metagenome]